MIDNPITIGDATLYLGDCMEYMATLPDKAFELAIVDPPYGIGANKMQLGNGKRTLFRGSLDWDSIPPSVEYFNELKRVSSNQIIWGANHFGNMEPSPCWIFWDKGTGSNDFADGELAWTSFETTVRKYFQSWVGANAKERNEVDRQHPTQKPVKLYEWLLTNYAKPGDRILDTHLGSCSSVIACLNMGYEITGCELDPDYFAAGVERVQNSQRQETLFAPTQAKQDQLTLETP